MRRNVKSPAILNESIKVITPPVSIENIKPFKKPMFSGNDKMSSGKNVPGSGTSVNTVVVGGFIN